VVSGGSFLISEVSKVSQGIIMDCM
jgi:hypothetical protein